MAHVKEDVLKKSLDVVEEHNCIFMEEIFAYTEFGCSTFYEYFPANVEKDEEESEGLKRVKAAIASNKIKTKSKQRKKWYASENATLQVALYKLIANDSELYRLNSQYIDHTSGGDKINLNVTAPEPAKSE